ncbi:MAG: hypothetical protein PHY40_03520 [Patescibacteria group bacterium]|nr:hypothetical protein [Patescibacteria group bacterium]
MGKKKTLQNNSNNGNKNLDELQKEAKKLIALLEDPHPGLKSWNDLLYENIEAIYIASGLILIKQNKKEDEKK